MITGGAYIMKEKKTAVITFRTEEWIKEALVEAAEQNKWSLAQLVEEVCKKFVVCPHPERITVKTKQLVSVIEEINIEGEETATEIQIRLQVNKNETDIEKTLSFCVLINGGLGCINDFETLTELTDEELLDIP